MTIRNILGLGNCDEVHEKYLKSWNDIFHSQLAWLFLLLLKVCVVFVPPCPAYLFPASIPHRTVTHNISTIHTAQMMMKLSGTTCFSLEKNKKTNTHTHKNTKRISHLAEIATTGSMFTLSFLVHKWTKELWIGI